MNPGEFAVGVAALAVMGGFAFWRLLVWIKNSPVHPDPWDAATEQALEQPDAVPVCHHCLTPVPPGQWFCETCGCAVGPYNNWMPYVDCFSEGEVWRNGVTARLRGNVLTVVGYILMSILGMIALPLFVLAVPFYWFLLFKNLFRHPPEAAASSNENAAG